MKEDLFDQRRSYEKDSISLENTSSDPFKQFKSWYNEAVDLGGFEANAMVISTASSDGFPNNRMVLLKQYSKDGFVFFTHYTSAKGKELSENPNVALLFFYESMERQIRIKGVAEQVSKEQSTKYFQTRPINSQYGAMISNQSCKISNQAYLEAEMDRIKSENEKPQRPEHWGGYLIKANYFEFWQGRPNRLHNRICYELNKSNDWQRFIIAP